MSVIDPENEQAGNKTQKEWTSSQGELQQHLSSQGTNAVMRAIEQEVYF